MTAMPFGCSEGKSGAASRALLEEIDKAQRRYDKASALMANPVFIYAPSGASSEMMPPLPMIIPDVDESKVRTPPPGTLNPKVLVVLKEAKEGLETALRANTDADSATVALAQSTIGRIAALRGAYHAAQAANERAAARSAAEELRVVIAHIGRQLRMIAGYEKLASRSSDDLQKIIQKAEGDATAINTELNSIDSNIADLKKRHAPLASANKTMSQQARELRTRSRLATGKEGLDLLEKALEKEETVEQNAAEIARIDYAVRSNTARHEELTLRLATANSLKAAAEASLRERKADTTAQIEAGKKLKDALEEPYRKLQTLGGTVAEALKKAASLEGDAVGAYDEAARLLGSAFKREVAARRPEAPAAQADAFCQMARVQADALAMKFHSQDVTPSFRLLWKEMNKQGEPPAFVKDIDTYVAKSAENVQAAAASFSKAIALYEKAVMLAKRNLKWTYQLQLAAAQIGLCDLFKARLGSMKAAIVQLDPAAVTVAQKKYPAVSEVLAVVYGDFKPVPDASEATPGLADKIEPAKEIILNMAKEAKEIAEKARQIRQKADEKLQEAQKGKAHSPFVRPVATRLRRLLEAK